MKHTIRHITLLILLITSVLPSANAQYIDSIRNTKAYDILHIGAPMIVVGTLVRPVKAGFQDIRNTGFPDFSYEYDDYTQYLPGIVTVALKASGVKSRSSWGRMLTSNAFGFITTTAVVNAGKYTIRDMRPDGSSRNSFPSGHTATAFAMATMLHQEYGDRSPWYSIGGYTVATITGISRILNNRHWLSDVIAGAGIGIASINFGYWLGDIIFKDKGLTDGYPHDREWEKSGNSFLGINAGYRLILSEIYEDGITMGNGSFTSIEGAWYIIDHLGIGASATLGNIPLETEGVKGNTNHINGEIGIYGNIDVVKDLLVAEGKVSCGYGYYNASYNISTPDNMGMCTSAAASLKFKSTSHFTSSLQVGYSGMPSPIDNGTMHSVIIAIGANMTF